MRPVVVMLVCVGLLLGTLPLAYGQRTTAVIQGVSYIAAKEGTERVEIVLNGAHPHNIFMLPGEKPRLVLDFPESGYAGKSPVAVTAGTLVRGIRVGVHSAPKPKTRVVIDLKPGSNVKWNQEYMVSKNLLVISITAEGKSAPAPVPAAPAQEAVVLSAGSAKIKFQQAPKPAGGDEDSEKTPPSSKSTPVPEDDEAVATDDGKEPPAAQVESLPVLVDVSFDNVYTKSGEMVLLKLNDFFPPEISAQEKNPPHIFCDFAKAKIGEGVQREMQTGGKYVEKIRVVQDDDQEKVRVTLDLVVGNNYDLQQVFFKEDNLFVLIVNLLDSEKVPKE